MLPAKLRWDKTVGGCVAPAANGLASVIRVVPGRAAWKILLVVDLKDNPIRPSSAADGALISVEAHHLAPELRPLFAAVRLHDR